MSLRTGNSSGRSSKTTASERLRLKVELLAPTFALPGRILLDHPRATELFPRFLATVYPVTEATVPLMEAALGRAREHAPHDPVAEALVDYLERHILEEMHGDEPGGALLDDLVALGVEPTRLREDRRAPQVAALIGAQYGWIFHRHPVALLGFLELEALHPHGPIVERLIERTGLPREGFRQLLIHSKLDIVHARDLHRLIDSLPLEPWHEQLIGVSALQTIGLLTEALLDVVRTSDLP
jgi:heme oxygenase-like protein